MSKSAINTLNWAVLIISALVLTFLYLKGCSNPTKFRGKKTSGVCQNGQVRESQCDAGYSGRQFEVCQGGKWGPSDSDTCTPGGGAECTETVFAPVQNVLKSNCVSCHPGYDQYQTAKAKAGAYITRINLADNDPKQMPPAAGLSDADVAKFTAWQADGFLEVCPGGPTGPSYFHQDRDYVEQNMVRDLEGIDDNDRRFIRYIITSNKFNQRPPGTDMNEHQAGVNKTINSISRNAFVTNGVPIDQAKTIFRIDLRDYDLNRRDWDLVELRDQLNFESFTARGEQLKFLAQTQKPWMHSDNFAFIVFEANTYYALLDLPDSVGQLFLDFGVDFDRDIANGDARFLGFDDSTISIQKARLIAGFDSTFGWMWISFDTDINLQNDDRNLFLKPLLDSASGNADYVFDAAEILFLLPNKMMGFYLANAAGVRQNAAPLTVVTDDRSDITVEIKVGISCHRCHSTGLVVKTDQILSHVNRTAAEFDINDVEQVRDLYGNDPQFAVDNNLFLSALGLTGAGVIDPITFGTDQLEGTWNSTEVAALLFLTESQFLAGLNGSAEGRAEIGQLLTGGSCTFGQLIDILPVLIRDLRIGRE